MILGPGVYCSERHIQSAVGEFARVLLWEHDDRLQCRLLVGARVTDVQLVPQFIVYSNSDTVDGESWTLQCEVLQHHPAEQVPPQEDPIPEDIDMEMGVPFDFFSLGQPVGGPEVLEDQNQEAQQGNWNPWPAEIPAQQQQPVQPIQQNQNLNDPPMDNQVMDMDLNQPPLNLDLHPVILNPILPDELEDNLIQLNDLQNNMAEQHLLQLENEVYMLDPVLPKEENLMQMVDEYQQEMINNLEVQPALPDPPASPIDYLGDEVPLDQLMGLGEDGFSDHESDGQNPPLQ